MAFVDTIQKRGLKPENVYICSFFAGLNEFGMLNQGVIYLAGRRVGRYLATYTKEKGNLEAGGEDLEQCRRALARLNSDLTMTLEAGDVCAEKDGDPILIKIKNPACRYCPKGVGEAELTGTLCPFPGLLEEYLSTICGKEFKLKKLENNKTLIKDGEWCKIRYSYR